ncbi:red chlorophyll catabolite reductase, chloroplastic-like [Vigna umbellata]|uniref:red chlorophyll catabolite reductase, chloroplastic-like n=1 Tax=Vigna umbellata TaxID=87088 RepID=UPI001F5FD70B|nr:red chlorophyll catabolite reductase, chloroplastic-like [Vigna umbellata]
MEVMICDHFRCSPLSILSSYRSSFSPSTRYPLSVPSYSPSFRLKPSSSSLSSSRMEETQETHDHGRSKFIDFPFVSAAQKNLMVELVSKLEDRFHSQLLPCTLPPDVQYYQSQTGTAQASLHIRSATDDSPVNFLFLNSSISI